MNKVKLALTLLSLLIVVVPLVTTLFLYRNNLLGLVITPEINSLVSGSLAQTQFQPPVPAGKPQYDPDNKTVTFSFTFTNPLKTDLSINELSTDIKCEEHNIVLGHATLEKPLSIKPSESAIVDAAGTMASATLDHFRAFHSDPQQDYVNVSFVNLKVDIGGIQLQLDELKNVGSIPLPR